MQYRRRADGTAARPFQTYTDPETYAAFAAAAKQQNISLGLYLDRLFQDFQERDGRLPAVSLPATTQTELPINTAA